MKCPYCDGTGQMICRSCGGGGSTNVLNVAYIPIFGFAMPESRICYDCSGSGKKKCSHCGGTGEIPDRK